MLPRFWSHRRSDAARRRSRRAPAGSRGSGRTVYALERLEDRTLPSGFPPAGATRLIAEAGPIQPTGSLQGTLAPGDADQYEFTVDQTGVLKAVVTPAGGGQLFPRLSLEDASGRLLIQSDGGGTPGGAASIGQYLPPGDYFLEVSGPPASDGTANGGSYVLTTAFGGGPPVTQLTAGRRPIAVVSADFNNDGHPDLAVANRESGTVSIFYGAGDGSFSPPTSPAVQFSMPSAIVAGDFTGNGLTDLAVADEGTGLVTVLLNDGRGGFTALATPFAGESPVALAVGDFSGDGALDLAVADSRTDEVTLLHNDGRVDFSVGSFCALPESSPLGLAVGDFNGGGLPDVAVAEFGAGNGTDEGAVTVLLNDGKGGLTVGGTFAAGSQPAAVAAVPEGSGRFDLAVADSASGELTLLAGDGRGGFAPAGAPGTHSTGPATYAVGSDAVAVAAADLNGDGLPDLVVANRDSKVVTVLLGRPDGTFAPGVSYQTDFGPSSVAVADFNGDGVADIAVTDADSGVDQAVTLLLGNGDGTFFDPTVSYPVASTPSSIAAGDFTGDGKSDLAVASAQTGEVEILLNNGDGTFKLARAYGVGPAPRPEASPPPLAIAVGDFNRDGRPDLAVADAASGDVTILLGDGDGTFQFGQVIAAGPDPDCLAVGRFTADGFLDIAVGSARGVEILSGNGDGTFDAGGTVGADAAVSAVAVKDSGPGRTLLAVGYSDHVVTMSDDGRGDFTPTGSYPVGAGVSAAAFGSDGGGRVLLAVTSQDADINVAVFSSSDGASFAPSASLVAGGAPSSVVLADLNGDGNPDVVVVDLNSDDFTVFPALPGGGFGNAMSYPAGGALSSVTVGDFTGDGHLSLAAADAGANDVEVLLNDGTGALSAAVGRSVQFRSRPLDVDVDGDGLPDQLVLDAAGQILLRKGLRPGAAGPAAGAADSFAPAVVLDTTRSRDFTTVRTPRGILIASVDALDDAVSLYRVTRDDRAVAAGSFATGPLPVRIVAGDPGDGRDALVVADGSGDDLTIALQSADGSFAAPFTRQVGFTPSDVVFADLGGSQGPDILASDQASGDVAVLYNDAAHSFAVTGRFRAGTEIFGFDTGGSATRVQSQLVSETVAAGNFTGSGGEDAIVVNRGDNTLMLLKNDGHGGFLDPTRCITLPDGVVPGAIVSGDFDSDGRPDLAILVTNPQTGASEVLVYLNQGGGKFIPQPAVDAGDSSTGLSLEDVNGDGIPDLLIGDGYGDVLTLFGDGAGSFAPDTRDLVNVPLAVKDLNGDGVPDVILADQKLDKVEVRYGRPGSAGFSEPVPLSSGGSSLLAPGAVLLADLNGDGLPDLVVASGSRNAVLVYQGLAGGGFGAPASFPVGDDPVALAAGYFNGSNVLDLVTANRGSNDLSVLVGSIDQSGEWVGTPGPRLHTGGSGPIAVAVRQTGAGVPNLVVTNESGSAGGGSNVSVLPGIGSQGKGTGFFNDTAPQTIPLGGTAVAAPTFDANAGAGFVPTTNGITAFDVANLTASSVFDGSGIVALGGGAGGLPLVAAFDDGEVALMGPAGNVFGIVQEEDPGFTDNPSALVVLQAAGGLEAYVSERGSDVPFIVMFGGVAPAGLQPAASTSAPTALPDSPLALVATLLVGRVSDLPSTEAAATEAILAVRGRDVTDAVGGAEEDEVSGEKTSGDEPPPQVSQFGADEAIANWLRKQVTPDGQVEVLKFLQDLLEQNGARWNDDAHPPGAPTDATADDAALRATQADPEVGPVIQPRAAAGVDPAAAGRDSRAQPSNSAPSPRAGGWNAAEATPEVQRSRIRNAVFAAVLVFVSTSVAVRRADDRRGRE